jgi:hypothetical protein
MTELFLCQQMLKLQLQMDQSHQSQSQFRSTGLTTSMKPTDMPFLVAILKLDILFLGYLLERDLEMLSPGLHLCTFLDFLSLAPSWVLLLQRSQNYSRILRVTDIIFKNHVHQTDRPPQYGHKDWNPSFKDMQATATWIFPCANSN